MPSRPIYRVEKSVADPEVDQPFDALIGDGLEGAKADAVTRQDFAKNPAPWIPKNL